MLPWRRGAARCEEVASSLRLAERTGWSRVQRCQLVRSKSKCVVVCAWDGESEMIEGDVYKWKRTNNHTLFTSKVVDSAEVFTKFT